jgi:sigma-B regulation protein RsbQ
LVLVHVVKRLNVVESGQPNGRPMLFAHGFGCDQNMWRFVAPEFDDSHRVIRYDLAGYGASDMSAYEPARYGSLDGYAEDVIDIVEELDLTDVVFVGHSVSAMIGALAAVRAPQRFAALVMVGPSPRYIDDDGYVGGFSAADIDGLLESIEQNYLGWSTAMAPAIMGNDERPQLGAELSASFCRADPDVALRFARATFLSDTRAVLPAVSTPTVVLQCSDDLIAPVSVGAFVRDQMPNATMVLLRATGHCPNLSAPTETVGAIRAYLASLPSSMHGRSRGPSEADRR